MSEKYFYTFRSQSLKHRNNFYIIAAPRSFAWPTARLRVDLHYASRKAPNNDVTMVGITRQFSI